MELPKLFQRGATIKSAPSPARYQAVHYNSNAHNNNNRSGCPKKIWVTFLLTLTSFLLLYLFQKGHYLLQNSGHGVVIDIGRLEARISVLRFEETQTLAIKVLGRKLEPTPRVAPYDDLPVLLGELLEYANGLVPEIERGRTRVHVLGTGGLEWVPVSHRLYLLEECRKSVRGSEFLFRDEWAVVVNDRDEGMYEWVAANYARSTVQSDPTDTIGVLNLGEESAQVAFVSETEPPFAYFYKIELWGTTHNLYSYSFDKLGLETASKSLLKLLHARPSAGSSGNEDPCSLRGVGGPDYFGNELAGDDAGGTATNKSTFPSTKPSGNFSACRAESLALLQQGQEACHDKHCPVGTVFVPELRGNFIATGKFYETLKYFSLPAMASLADLVAAGESYCGGAVEDILKDPVPEYEAVRKPCFSAAFIVAFLHDSLGLPVTGNQVVFKDGVNGVPVEWTVGLFVTHLVQKTTRQQSSSPAILMLGDELGNVAVFLGLFALFGMLVWLVARWRRPQLKTIYDLEKGRYFTTAARGR